MLKDYQLTTLNNRSNFIKDYKEIFDDWDIVDFIMVDRHTNKYYNMHGYIGVESYKKIKDTVKKELEKEKQENTEHLKKYMKDLIDE